MRSREEFDKHYRSIIAAMAQAVETGSVHGFYVPGMKKGEIKTAIKCFVDLFPGCPVFDSLIENDSGSVRVERDENPRRLIAGVKAGYLDEAANKEVYLFEMNASLKVSRFVAVPQYWFSVERYNRENPATPPRYELLLNYPAARMLLLDRQTLEVPEDEIREHFFRADPEGQI